MTTTAEHLDRVVRDLAGLLSRISEEQLSAPTPCTDFDLATLRAHVVGWLTAFTDGYGSPDGQCSDADEVTVRDTGTEQVLALADRLAITLPEGMTRPLRIGESQMPGDMAASMILWEYQVHGWDLARATAQDWQPDPEGVEASLQFAPAMLTPDFQGEGKPFAVSVPVAAGADPLTRLVGLSGRDPQWSPATPGTALRTEHVR